MKPTVLPQAPHFSSGPCAKRPGWAPTVLSNAAVGRSHRSKLGKSKLKAAIDGMTALLHLPADYRLAIVPASDTGAIEMAMWSMLGARGVDMVAWESFGKTWVSDVVGQLKLQDVRCIEAAYGALPDMSAIDTDRDVVFTWNGTTSGVKVTDGDWIAADRAGLTFCDATSAAFAMDLPWEKLDVTTFSWQKVLGGEAAHGVLVLSPRAVARLESYTPPWPLPKIFRMTKKGKLDEALFAGATLNTVSLLCVEDLLDALAWAESCGGLAGLIARSEANLAVIADWVAASDWCDFLAVDPATRSNTSICLRFTDPWATAQDSAAQAAMAKAIEASVEAAGAGFDINGYRDAPPGLRIWGGATVESADIAALLPWLDWAYGELKRAQTPAG
ncbi:MAG: phosphoserine transaminase [Rhodospirillaceae bacterium]